jgi:molybdopterin-containing oxidoreductase family iron-sulfur binding subunit
MSSMSAAQQPRYWKSLDDLHDSAECDEWRAREFPSGAAEPPDGISRRTMLQLVGASLSLAGLAACRRPVEYIVPYVNAPELIVPGIPLRYATAMPFAGSALGLVVESHEGRPTKIEGNELHPASHGAQAGRTSSSIGRRSPPSSPPIKAPASRSCSSPPPHRRRRACSRS